MIRFAFWRPCGQHYLIRCLLLLEVLRVAQAPGAARVLESRRCALEKPQCNRDPASFPQSFLSFLPQLLRDHLFQPSSFCLSGGEVAWSHNVSFVLFRVWSEETGKEQRALNSPRFPARGACGALLRTGYLHLFGPQIQFGGLLQRAVVLALRDAARWLCAACRRNPVCEHPALQALSSAEALLISD